MKRAAPPSQARSHCEVCKLRGCVVCAQVNRFTCNGDGQGDTPSQRRARLDSHMRALNTQFSGWLQRQLSECPQESWAQEVQQYITYTRMIQEDFSDVIEADSTADLRHGPVVTAAAPAAAATPAVQPSTFGERLNPPTTSVPLAAPAPLAAPLVPPSPFATSAGFNLGAPSTSAQPSFQFNFTPAAASGLKPFAPSPFGTAAGATVNSAQVEEDGEDEPQRPPSPSVVRSKGDDGEEVVFDGKAKFLALINKEWVNKGVGNLQLRRPKDAPTGSPGPRLLLYNQAGKLVLNAKLYAGMKVKHADDKGIALVLVNGAQSGSEGVTDMQPVQTMLRVKDGVIAKELMRLVVEHVPAY